MVIKIEARHQGQIYLSLSLFILRDDNSFESTIFYIIIYFALRPLYTTFTL
jgi:hypothetical protein